MTNTDTTTTTQPTAADRFATVTAKRDEAIAKATERFHTEVAKIVKPMIAEGATMAQVAEVMGMNEYRAKKILDPAGISVGNRGQRSRHTPEAQGDFVTRWLDADTVADRYRVALEAEVSEGTLRNWAIAQDRLTVKPRKAESQTQSEGPMSLAEYQDSLTA